MGVGSLVSVMAGKGDAVVNNCAVPGVSGGSVGGVAEQPAMRAAVASPNAICECKSVCRNRLIVYASLFDKSSIPAVHRCRLVIGLNEGKVISFSLPRIRRRLGGASSIWLNWGGDWMRINRRWTPVNADICICVHPRLSAVNVFSHLCVSVFICGSFPSLKSKIPKFP